MSNSGTLTVFCPLGLSNRLRVLLSGLALAEAAGRRFKMLWPITPACAAPFDTLFDAPWPVETVDAKAVADLPYFSGWFGQLPDLLAAPETDVIIGCPGWLVKPGLFPGHQGLELRCRELFSALKPVPAIQRVVDSFRLAHFQPTMIGVHLRRGDSIKTRPDTADNTAIVMAQVKNWLERWPTAGIFLSSDEVRRTERMALSHEGVHRQMAARFGHQVVWTTPRSLDRRTPEAIQDALVDLWLLRQTDAFIGTVGSSFSELAVFGRDVPAVHCAGSTRGYRRFEQTLRATGLYQTIRAIGRRQFKREVPFPALWRYYICMPRRIAGRILKRVSPALYQLLRTKNDSPGRIARRR